MKKILSICLLLLPAILFGQECGGYFYLQKNATIQMSSFNKNNEPGVVVTSHVLSVSPTSGGVTSDFTTTIKDQKGAVLDQAKGQMNCENGNLMVSMRQSIPASSLKEFQNMRVEASEGSLAYPSSMQVGQHLSGASFHMDIYKNESAKKFATVSYTISDRTVTGKESLTTPAGNWDCLKISYKMVMKVKIGIGIPTRFNVVEWFVPGFGIVKTADYNKKGKLIGYTELTMLKK